MADETPTSLGYRMPAEWEPHAATWIAWPHNKEDWPGKFGPIPWVYADIVRHLSRVERVEILVQDEKLRDDAADRLTRAGAVMDNVGLHLVKTDRVWTRDSGPSMLTNGKELGLVHWVFNGWAKYENHKRDGKVPRAIGKILNRPRWKPTFVDEAAEPTRVVLEGGSIDVNGKGTVLTTEECLLSPIQARNPKLDRAGIERFLADYLGASHVVWLNEGIVGDDTHGHVDDLCRFVNPTTVVTVMEHDESDENHARLKDNRERLSRAHDQDGRPLDVVELPMPRPLVFEGQRVPASYANFYIANGLVLVPTFNDPADRIALNILADLFPASQVVGIHCGDLVWGLGTLHCMTQQQPALSADPA